MVIYTISRQHYVINKTLDRFIAGAGLAFIVYPEVVSRLPISPLWAILFFAMLITLGLGTQFSVITAIHTTLLDVFPQYLRKGKRPTLLMILICILGFLLGLSCCTRVSVHMFNGRHLWHNCHLTIV
jgi:solute carrier family 6 amino acid transporter-like protein 5/7/9/14